MGRNKYKYIELNDFRGGINVEPENAQVNQLLDARNVWAPEGELIQRPGSVGVVAFPPNQGAGLATAMMASYQVASTTTTTAAFTATLDLSPSGAGLKAHGATNDGDYFYVGVTVNPYTQIGAMFQGNGGSSVASTEDVGWWATYWNGSQWRPLTITAYSNVLSMSASAGLQPLYRANTSDAHGTYFHVQFVPPADWTATTLPDGSNSRYWLRLRLVDLGSANLSNGAQIENTARLYSASPDGDYYGKLWYLTPIIGPNTNRLLAVWNPDVTTYTAGHLVNAGDLSLHNTYAVEIPSAFGPLTDPEFSVCTIPDRGEVYITNGNGTFVVPFTPSTDAAYSALATVETDPTVVGTIGGARAPYNPDFVAQLSSWPQGKYIHLFNQVLFVAGGYDDPQLVRWSAAGPLAIKVWPEESFEYLVEADESGISGLSSLTEFPVVFKRDSIWNMVYTGPSPVDETGGGDVPQFSPVKQVSGIGCVSHNSIQRTPIGLIFHSENGIYAYDGRNAAKLSDAIDPIIRRINAGRYTSESSVYWRKYNCYMLAVSLDGSATHNAILVYDLKHQAWWLWDGITPQILFNIESAADTEEVYYANDKGWVYRFIPSVTNDHGATIEASITTHRLGDDGLSRVVRQVDVQGNSKQTALKIEVTADDSDTATIGTLDFQDDLDPVYDTARFGSALWAKVRRAWRRLMFRVSGEQFTVTVRSDTKDQFLNVNRISVGFIPKGNR